MAQPGGKAKWTLASSLAKSKRQQESLENGQLLSGCGFVQNITHRRFLVIGG